MKAASRSNGAEGCEPHDNVHSDHLHPSREAVEDDEQDYQRESRGHGHGEEAVGKEEHSATLARLIRHLSDREVTLSLVEQCDDGAWHESLTSLENVYEHLKQLAVSDACQALPGANSRRGDTALEQTEQASSTDRFQRNSRHLRHHELGASAGGDRRRA